MQVQQQVYLQHALNAFESGAVAHALAYIAHIEAPVAADVWVQIAERLAAAPCGEQYRHAWCARVLDVPDAQRACAAARFLHALWRVTFMQVQGRALTCATCRVRAEERALEPRCDACRRIDAAFAQCAQCGFRHGPLCLACDAAHPACIPCAAAARPPALSMGAGLYMPMYLRAALASPVQTQPFKRRPRDRAPARPAPPRAVSPETSRVSLILRSADPAQMFSVGEMHSQ